MTLPQLRDLTRAAAERNRRAAITGLMLYADGRFYQWLEGPPDAVERLLASILRDPRHTDIDVHPSHPVAARTFRGWNMKLAAAEAGPASSRDDVIEPPGALVVELREHPHTAPALLAQLAPWAEMARADGRAHAAEMDATAGVLLHRNTAAILKRVMLAEVIPRLMGGDGGAPARADIPMADLPQAIARATELAELLIAPDQAAAVSLIHELHATARSVPQLFSTLLEPAARTLGDLWSEDICSEFDLTLGLCRLQTAIRLLGGSAHPVLPSRLPQPAVLIVPEPGELHRLGAALDSTILGDAGWDPHCDYPADDRALQELLAATWFDALDLSLSIALRREHWLPRLTETIARARRASQNPALVVVVGGRVFLETAQAGADVGADAVSKTSGSVARSILKTMNAARTHSVSPTNARQVTATPG